MSNPAGAYHHGNLQTALLEEAADMIAEGGAESVTMRALGLRLGVSRSAAYRHFADKDALLIAVAAAGFGRLAERAQSVDTDSPRPGDERLRRLGHEYVRFALENPAHYRLMYGKEAIGRRDVPELRDAGNALFEQLVDEIQAFQRHEGIEGQDPRAQAYVAWAAVHGLASLLIEGQIMADVDVDALIRRTTQTVLDGLRAR